MQQREEMQRGRGGVWDGGGTLGTECALGDPALPAR